MARTILIYENYKLYYNVVLELYNITIIIIVSNAKHKLVFVRIWFRSVKIYINSAPLVFYFFFNVNTHINTYLLYVMYIIIIIVVD